MEKNIITSTIGLTILPSCKPNFIHNLLKGNNNSGLVKVIINKIAAKILSKYIISNLLFI